MDQVALLIATVGRVGFFPIAPGTVGSAAGLVVWAAVLASGAGDVAVPATALLMLVVGAWAATHAARVLGTEDPGPVVIDEVAGMLVTLAGAPFTWQAGLLGFVLFRVCDVIKPWPANRLEHVPGGWGIMLDDIMAGVYAALMLQLAWRVWPGGLA